MIPRPPPREGALGFLYLPPVRVQGTSIAGEATCIQVPEYDVCFDIGCCPRAMLSSKLLAISHGHMDHIGGLAYFCSQRYFQGMGEAHLVCDSRVAPAIDRMMAGYVELERQRTPYKLTPMQPDQEIPLKASMVLRAIEVEHTVPTLGYIIVERRSKLKQEYVGLPQEKLRELKERGTEITRTLEIPLVAYLGDTQPGPHLIRPDVLASKVVICECTFTEPEHRERARVGMHMYAEAIGEWLNVLQCDALVLTHLSRRTNLAMARKRLTDLAGPEKMQRVHLLMDHRVNRDRYQQQEREAEALAAAHGLPVEHGLPGSPEPGDDDQSTETESEA
jgi:ribonuclease Z